MTIEEIKDTLQTWIRTADDEFDREEMGRVYGLKSALRLIGKLDVTDTNAGDLISRDAVLDLVADYDLSMGQVVRGIHALPSVTPKQRLCKDCKFFEYDSVAKVDGILLIVAHEICNKWGNGCRTREDGYCFLFEPQESEEV